MLLPHGVPVDFEVVERRGLLRELRVVVREAAGDDVALVVEALSRHVRVPRVHGSVSVSSCCRLLARRRGGLLPLLARRRGRLLSGKEKGNRKHVGQNDDDHKLIGLTL